MGEGTICPMWWICPSTIKHHGDTNPYPKWANRGCGHGNTESFNRRKIYFNVANGKGSKFLPPLQTTQRVVIDPQITTLEPFDMFHCPRD
jgi:hypothetical protein